MKLKEDTPVTTVAGGGEGLENPKLPIKTTLFRRFQDMKRKSEKQKTLNKS